MKTLAIALSVLFLTGCGTLQQSKFAVKQGSELATVVALQEMEATKGKAIKVHTIAVQVKDLIGPDGEIDSDVLKTEIVRAINENFEPSERLVLLLLLNNIMELVMHEIEKDPIPSQHDVLVLVHAAADGVAAGSKIYIMSLEEPSVRILNVSSDKQFDTYINTTGRDMQVKLRMIIAKAKALQTIKDPEARKQLQLEINRDMKRFGVTEDVVETFEATHPE